MLYNPSVLDLDVNNQTSCSTSSLELSKNIVSVEGNLEIVSFKVRSSVLMVKQGINFSTIDDDFVVNDLMRLGRDGHLSTYLEWVVSRDFSNVDLHLGFSRLMTCFGSNKICDSFSFNIDDVQLGSTVWVSIQTKKLEHCYSCAGLGM